jgi:cytosine/adenosine deaminase-related metal-dependent hydrolase
MRAAGTALAGEVTNSLDAVSALEHADIGGALFHELLGFRPADPVAPVHDALARLDELERREQEFHWPDEAGAKTASAVKARVARHSTVVAHAPYSTSPALFKEIARHRGDAPLSVHLGESSDEIEFLHTGRGPFRHLLEELGVWDPSWQAPGCDPVEYLQRLGYLHEGCLVVHGTHLTAKDRDMIREADAVVVTCPRSNAWVGVGLPPVTRFYDEGLRVAIGTDSLASSPTLSMFDELAELRRIAPEVDAGRLLESATRVGAEALGFPDFGTLAPGQRAVFATVRVPGGITDVEEYLVSGVPAGATSLLT